MLLIQQQRTLPSVALLMLQYFQKTTANCLHDNRRQIMALEQPSVHCHQFQPIMINHCPFNKMETTTTTTIPNKANRHLTVENLFEKPADNQPRRNKSPPKLTGCCQSTKYTVADLLSVSDHQAPCQASSYCNGPSTTFNLSNILLRYTDVTETSTDYCNKGTFNYDGKDDDDATTTITATADKKVPPRFQCSDCNRSYSTFSGLSKHKQFHCSSQGKRQFGCKFCDKSYSSIGYVVCSFHNSYKYRV